MGSGPIRHYKVKDSPIGKLSPGPNDEYFVTCPVLSIIVPQDLAIQASQEFSNPVRVGPMSIWHRAILSIRRSHLIFVPSS